MSHSDPGPSHDENHGDKYTVVARRYRPKTFEELVGQDTVAQALLRAIETHRVGHAYLFTGARGVGKTSTARIFAKALNASEDGSGKFDPASEIAQAIDTGEDMDVIEIDGASNRGIDEIRQLRSNAAIRPSRSRYKIYIIDEVHMLTTQAFNALLKTLEEPPAHVKFIFCTTDPEKIPITVLSRCQRFDFPPVKADQILARLQFICQTEGAEAEEPALRLIARRAAGSMRDSQSLLEQLLSFCNHKITVEDVHSMLGTADETRLANFAQCMIERNASGALMELDAAMSAGVDPGQLAEQLLGYLRDMMAVSIGAPAELMRTANPNSYEALCNSGRSWGTMTLLSALQLLDETIVRMKHSVQSRILLEVALVQICNLTDLQALSDVIKAISSGQTPTARPAATTPTAGLATAAQTPTMPRPPTPPAAVKPAPTASKPPAPSAPPVKANDADEAKKKVEATESSSVLQSNTDTVARAMPEPSESPSPHSSIAPTSTPAPVEYHASPQPSPAPSSSPASAPTADEPNIESLRKAASSLEGLIQQAGSMALEVTEPTPGHWQIHMAREASYAVPSFQSSHNHSRLVRALREVTGRDLTVEFVLTNRSMPGDAMKLNDGHIPELPAIPQNQRIRDAMTTPIVRKFLEMFEGQVLRVDDRPPMERRIAAPHSDSATPVATTGDGAEGTEVAAAPDGVAQEGLTHDDSATDPDALD
ncbi:MAG: DNA polymerase III subunit gamma/tau [Pirellula sp.]